MNQSAITFIINGTTYRLSADDSSAIRSIPEADRAELVALLQAVQVQDVISKNAIDAATARMTAQMSRDQQIPKAERLGSGDVDALMARLVMEDKGSRKPELTKQGVYKGVAIFAATVFIVIIIL
ncbi:MAG: hypothetical protein ACI9DH_000933 [Halioglobus sp.]|jgi:hypothetical protein